MKEQSFTLWYRFQYKHRVLPCHEFTNEFSTFSVSLDPDSLMDHLNHVYSVMKELEKNHYKGSVFVRVNDNTQTFASSMDMLHTMDNFVSIYRYNISHTKTLPMNQATTTSIDNWVEL